MANLNFAQPGIVVKGSNTTLWDATVSAWIKRTEAVLLQGMDFCQKHTEQPILGTNAEMSVVLTSWSNIMGLPRKSSTTAPNSYDMPAPGRKTTINVYTFRRAIRIDQDMVRLDRSGHIGEIIGGLPDSGRRQLEYAIADVFNNYATYLGEDGLAAFHTAHLPQHSSEGSTWANLGTGAALSPATFNSGRITAARRTGERGYVTDKEVTEIICTPNIEQVARQIATSDHIADSSLLGSNPWKGVSVRVYKYITSTTAWGLKLTGPDSDKGINYVEMTAPSVKNLGYPTPDYSHIVAGYELFMQYGIGVTEIKNIIWNVGA